MVIIDDERIEYEQFFGVKNYKKHIKTDEEEYFYTVSVIKEDTYKCEGVDIEIKRDVREKYIPIKLENLKYIRIQGIVRNKKGEFIKNKKIIVYRSRQANSRQQYIPICETTTDEFGIYQVIADKIYSENSYIIRIR